MQKIINKRQFLSQQSMLNVGKLFKKTIFKNSLSRIEKYDYQFCYQTVWIIIIFFYQIPIKPSKMKLSSEICIQTDCCDVNLYKPLISTKFHLSGSQNFDQKCRTHLYENKIIVEVQELFSSKYYEIFFQYDLKCILKQNNQEQEKNIDFDQICYIKLIINQSFLEFRQPQQKEHFKIWKEVLQRNLMQFGFYANYTPLNQLGQGSFAKIFLAQNNTDKKYSALKTFSKQYQFQKENGRNAFMNQINVMRLFNHKNLLKIHEVYENEHSLFVCMQLLSGGNLMDKINQKAKFNSIEVKAIMKSLLYGLEEMHKKKIMHRDLKPDNILFRYYDSYQCVIGDFGLAEHVEKQFRIYNICGTPGFVAPEILNSKKGPQYNEACDIFSLGVIFHLILLGKIPFQGENLDELYESNRECDINFEQFEYHQLPSTWLKFLKQLLQVDPKKRLTATEALAHNFFKKQPLVKKITTRSKKSSQEIYQLDIENKININEFDQILKKKPKRNSRCLRIIQNTQKITYKQNKSGDRIQSLEKSVKSLNSPLKDLKKTKLQQSKFRVIAFNNS